MVDLESVDLRSNFSFATENLCDLGQVTVLALGFLICKMKRVELDDL